MKSNIANFHALTIAAENYENCVAKGEAKGEAFRRALALLADIQLSINSNRKQEIARKYSRVVVPREIPAIIARYAQASAGDDWRRVLSELTGGTSKLRYYSRLRDELAYVLESRGYHPAVIGMALNRDRTTVLDSLDRFAARMAADEVLSARMAKISALISGAEVASGQTAVA